MNEIDRIAALAAQADRSAAPPALPDLAEGILADIRRGRGDHGGSRVWQATAAATCALAIVAAVTAARSWSSLDNPLSDLSDTTNSVEMR